MITSPGRVATRACATGSGSTSATDGSARLPTITGCTNSTATWWAWGSHWGEITHSVAPAWNLRASESDAEARSSLRSSPIKLAGS